MTKDDFAGSIKKYEGQMYRFALSIVRNETDAEDVVSETIRKAYENLNKLKIEESLSSGLCLFCQMKLKECYQKEIEKF